jgi:hypothetical protein
MTLARAATMAIAVFAQPCLALAQAPADAPAAVPAPAATLPADPASPPALVAMVRIPAGTVVRVELTEALSSKTSARGQTFALRLVEPIVVDGQTVVAAGAVGGGEVIDARPAGFGGRPGKLVLAGRFLEMGGQQARIRSMMIGATGEDRAADALAVSTIPVIGIASLFMEGGEIQVPVGARATAKLAVDIDVPAPASTTPAPQAAPPAEQPQQQPAIRGDQQ